MLKEEAWRFGGSCGGWQVRSSRDRLEKGEQEKQLRVNLSQQPTWEALEKSMRREGSTSVSDPEVGEQGMTGGTWHTADVA